MDNTLGGFLRFPIDQIPFVFLVLVIAFTLHEFAHAFTADKFGDPTPRSMGRVTLNPRVHLDILGTILIFLMGFGWAKPVLIKRSNFKYPRLMGILVSFAGPLANLVVAFLGMFIFYLLADLGALNHISIGALEALRLFFGLLINLNIVLFIFNLLPLPPLDGYRILQDFLPLKIRLKLQQYEQWAVYVFLLLVFIPPLYGATVGRIFTLTGPILYLFEKILSSIFGNVFI